MQHTPFSFRPLGATRRRWLQQLGAALALGPACLSPSWALTQRRLQFPQDHGAHPDTRTEWWYLTGWLHEAAAPAPPGVPPQSADSTVSRPPAADAPLWGFQVTFFRSRVAAAQGLSSRLAARQLVFAHAALTDVAGQRHAHVDAIARWNGQIQPQDPRPIAAAREGDTDVWLGRWQLQRQASGVYQTELQADALGLSLQATPQQQRLLQGHQGWSRKGPDPEQASFYYSQPQLRVSGQLRLGTRRLAVQGRGWLDHEWSTSLLHPEAVGWDWVGFNLHDGNALTAFRLRRADGSALWAGGSWRSAGRASHETPERIFSPSDLQWQPLDHWTSPRTAVRYPVRWRLVTPLGPFEVAACLPDQELDSRQSTGTVYWEGLSRLLTPTGQELGLGYLELTGYGDRLQV